MVVVDATVVAPAVCWVQSVVACAALVDAGWGVAVVLRGTTGQVWWVGGWVGGG